MTRNYFVLTLAVLVTSWGCAAAVNECLDPASAQYKCNFATSTVLNLKGCGIADADVDGEHLAACLDSFGRSNIGILGLDRNELTTIPVGLFDDLGAMTILRLNRNQLATLPDGIFGGLAALTLLRLTNNQLAEPAVGLFDGLVALERLFLGRNQLTTLPSDLFNGLGALKRLHLFDNQVTTLPDGIFDDLGTLEVLSLNDNELTTLPDGLFGALGTLERLDLRINDLECVPVLPSSDTEVQVDDSVSTECGSEAVNQCLDPASAGYKCNFDGSSGVLNLENCGITDADVEGGHLSECFDSYGRSNIGDMSLQHNELTTLPESLFFGLVALTSLDLSNNNLTTLPEGLFGGLGAMRVLFLTSNDLTTLPEGLFGGLGAMSILTINFNDLTTLPGGLFDDLGNLQGLTIIDNDLATLPDGIFDGLGQLRFLSLQRNNLKTLPAGLFDDLGILESLDLSQNDLECLPAVPSNVGLLLVDDPIGTECGCDLFSSPDIADPCAEQSGVCTPGAEGFICGPSSTPAPTPEPIGGDTCSNGLPGIQGSNDRGVVCCPLECNQCGGGGCGSNGDPGFGSRQCCVNGVLDNQDSCFASGAAPCIIVD